MLAKKPPMGWNSWNTFGEDINEELIMQIADIIVKEGYKDAGYEYIVIDDCWSLKERDENGKLVADPKKFPHGMKYLSDYIHEKGLKFGMYSCSGVLTCSGYPGSYGHEFEDAQTFASWGVDFLKYDYCEFLDSADVKNAFTTMSMALKSSGREILFSACNWGEKDACKWMRSRSAHMYRSTWDIHDSFESMKNIVMSQVDNFSMSAPGGFNDIDMLIVGMYGKGNVGIDNGCSDSQYKMHFALWCLFGTPLMIGADIRNINEFSKNLLLNKELISINQDEENRPPYLISTNYWTSEGFPVFFKHLSDNEYIIAMFNMTDKEKKLYASFVEAGIPAYSNKGFFLTDCFTGKELGVFKDLYTCTVDAYDCVILKGRVVNV